MPSSQSTPATPSAIPPIVNTDEGTAVPSSPPQPRPSSNTKGRQSSPGRNTTQQVVAPGVELNKGGKRLIARLLVDDKKSAGLMGIGVTRESGMHMTKSRIFAATFGGSKREVSSGVAVGISKDTPSSTTYSPTLSAVLASKLQPADGKPTGNTFAYTSCFTGSETGRVPEATDPSSAKPYPTASYPGRPLSPTKGIIPLSRDALSDRFGPTKSDFHETKEEYLEFMKQRQAEKMLFNEIATRAAHIHTTPSSTKSNKKKSNTDDRDNDSDFNDNVDLNAPSHAPVDQSSVVETGLTTTSSSSPTRRTGRIPRHLSNESMQMMGKERRRPGQGRFDGWTSRSVIIDDPNAKSALEKSVERLSRPTTKHDQSSTAQSIVSSTPLSPVAEERHERLYGHAQRRLDYQRQQKKMAQMAQEAAADEGSVAFDQLQKIINGQFKERVEIKCDKMGRPLSPPKSAKMTGATGVQRAKSLLANHSNHKTLSSSPQGGGGSPPRAASSNSKIVDRVAKVAAIACPTLSTPHKLRCPHCIKDPAFPITRAHSSNSTHRPPLSQSSSSSQHHQHRPQSSMAMMSSSPTTLLMASSSTTTNNNNTTISTAAERQQLARGVGARTKGSQFSFGDTPFGMGVGETVPGGVMVPQKLPTPQEQEEAWRLRRLEAHTPLQSHQLLLNKGERDAPNAMRKRQGDENTFLKKHGGVGGGQVGAGALRQHKADVQAANNLKAQEKEQARKLQAVAEEEELKKAEEGRSQLQQRVDGQLQDGIVTGTPGIYRIVRKQQQVVSELDDPHQPPPPPPPAKAVRGAGGAMIDAGKEEDDQVVKQYDGWKTDKYNNTMLVACSFGSAGNQHSRFHISDRPPCFNSRGAIATAGLGDAKVGAGSRGAKLNAATALPVYLQPDEGGFQYVASNIPRVDHQRRKRHELAAEKRKKSTLATAGTSSEASPPSSPLLKSGGELLSTSPSSSSPQQQQQHLSEAKRAVLALSKGRGVARGQSAMLISMFGSAEDLDADEKVIQATRELLGKC